MCMDYYVLCTNYVVFMCIFTLLCLLATTRNPCVALQRQLSIGNYEVAFVHFINHALAVMTVTCLCASSIFFYQNVTHKALGI